MAHVWSILTAMIVFVSPRAAHAEQPPHVIFIVVDDLNDWIGCLDGHPRADTPNMDRLAARGVLFANAHCAAPECNPSRAAILSGKMPSATGVWSNRDTQIESARPKHRLLPQAFADAGYRTLGAGKIFHTGGGRFFHDHFEVEQRWSPLTTNLVRPDLRRRSLPAPKIHKRNVTHKGRTFTLPINGVGSGPGLIRRDGDSFDWGPFDVPDSEFGDSQITDWAIEQLHTPVRRSIFLAVGYYRPHVPLWAPKRFFDRFDARPPVLPNVQETDLDDLSDAGRKLAADPSTAGSHTVVVEHQQWHAAVAAYLACTTFVDHEIGRLLDAFDNSPMSNNTLVVLCSDHGWHLGEKQHWGKWTGWERSTRVPLVIVPPQKSADRFAPAGDRCEQPVSLLDLFPTFAEFCSLTAPSGLDGKSLVSLLRNPGQSTERIVNTTFGRGNASLRSERWRYIRYADGAKELYDLRNDPNEWKNLSSNPRFAPVLAMFAEHVDH